MCSSLKEQLVEDMKAAMKARDKKKVSVIRMARAAIKNEEIEKRKELTNDEVMAVLAREVKQHRQSIEEYKRTNQDETVAELKREIDILNEYLPEQLSKEELTQLVTKIIDEVAASDMSDIGKVMGAIMPRIRGRADGKVVNEIVREKLTNND